MAVHTPEAKNFQNCCPDDHLLHTLDGLALECDGMARVVSTLLQRERIVHRVLVGRLAIDRVGAIAHHWWVALADGRVLDLRARMWLGSDVAVPHGLFKPAAHQHYQDQWSLDLAQTRLSAMVFKLLTGLELEATEALHV